MTFPTPSEAAKARALALADAAKGVHVDRRRSGMTVDEWFELWSRDRRVRKVTADHDAMRWRNHITPHLGRVRLDALSPYVVERWLRWMQATGRTPATQRKAYVLLKTALGAHGAVGDRRIAVNPCDGVRAPKHDAPVWRQLGRDEFERIVENVPEGERLVVLLAAYAGLRWSEIAGLRRMDYNPLRGVLVVSQGLVRSGRGVEVNAPKSGKARVVPVHPRLKTALDAACVGVDPEGLVCTTRDGSPLHASNWRNRVWTPALKAAGVEGVRFHDCRHAFASWLLEGGADLAQVRDLLGHASITTTQLYLHVNADRQREAVLRALS